MKNKAFCKALKPEKAKLTCAEERVMHNRIFNQKIRTKKSENHVELLRKFCERYGFHSVVRKRFKLAVAGRTVHDELVLLRLLDEAGLHELRHQAVGHLAVFVFLLEQLHLLLHLLELRQLRLGLGHLLFLGELLLADLLQRAAALAAHLQHVGGDALAHWRGKVVREEETLGGR